MEHGMQVTRRHRVVGAAVGIAALAGGGVAIAANQLNSPQAESQAVVDDAAGRLHVSPSQLSDALVQALSDRVDAAVAAHELTQAQGDALKAQIKAGNVPLAGIPFGFGRFHHGFGPGFGHGPGFDHGPGPGFGPGADLRKAAASYLGLSEAALEQKLESGQSLAQVAAAQNKTTTGLEQSLTAAITADLDAAVKDQRLTAAQEKQILAGLPARLDHEINETHEHGAGPGDGDHHGWGGGPGWGGPSWQAPPTQPAQPPSPSNSNSSSTGSSTSTATA
jgi:hypothetical protein